MTLFSEYMARVLCLLYVLDSTWPSQLEFIYIYILQIVHLMFQ